MSSNEKLFFKAKASPNNFHFADLCLLAERVGFILKKSSGSSHRIYVHSRVSGKNLEGFMNFQNVGGKAKSFQVKQLVAFIEAHGLI